MGTTEIRFTQQPSPQQLVSKAAGVIQRSKVSLTHIMLSYRHETIELFKDKETGEWTGRGKIAGTSAAELIG